MTTSIRLDQITKVFGSGRQAARAVDGVTLTIEPGELFFLLGPSGCGKTTLLRMVAGFIEPTSGRIRFGERDVTALPPNKRNTGMVFQSYALWPHMTVEQNVAFGLSVRRVGREERSRRVREALDAVQMGQYIDRKPNQLSGGQQQRIALARALVIRPDVLLLDEPLSNLDAKLRNDLRLEIRRICKTAGAHGEGITAVYVTHDQKEALSMADRVAIMRLGKVVQLGVPTELYRRPATRFVAEFLGETNLLEGDVAQRVHENGATKLVVDTPAGRLVAGTLSSRLADDASRVLLSVRPEAFRVVPGNGKGTNALAAGLSESTYLGEIAQLHCKLAGGSISAKVALLNPHAAQPVGDRFALEADPEDVVALPIAD